MNCNFKKIIGLFLATVLIVSFAGCGKKEGTSGAGSTDSVVFKNEDSVDLGTPDVTLDPATVYANLTYTPEMFYGQYGIPGGDSADDEFCANSEYFIYNDGEEDRKLTKLPYTFRAGKNTLNMAICNVEEYEWIELHFGCEYTEGREPSLYDIIGAYTIEGNTITIKPLKSLDVDSENKKIAYEFADTTLQYQFSFNGRNVTLSTEGQSVTLTACLSAYRDHDHYYVDNYVSPDSEKIDNIDYINMLYENENNNVYIYFETADKEKSYTGIAKFDNNGLLTFTVPFENGTKTYQYVAFFCEYDGIVLTDGTNTYYYNDSYRDRNNIDARKYISEDMTGKISELSEEELKKIIEKKDNLMDDLAAAFESAGIKVTVDNINGEIRMDSAILFSGDSSVLSDEGKAMLNKFVEVYTSIVFSDEYEGFIEKTIVEGHTAPLANSTYESGLPLSVERANVVKDYCLSSETNVDTAELSAAIEANGMSNAKPVIDAYGKVDLDASRRVSFRFIINIG